jgi:predicted CoA-binding protein
MNALAQPSDEDLIAIYRSVKTIAVVGASANPSKPAYAIPSYLHSQGYRVVPVNPRGGELFGERAYPSLREIDHPVDVVDVFRPPHEAEAVARDAIAIGARVLWFQPGTARSSRGPRPVRRRRAARPAPTRPRHPGRPAWPFGRCAPPWNGPRRTCRPPPAGWPVG